MKVEVVYVAYDDTRFNSPAECKEYENRAMSLMEEFNDHVLLLDMTKRPILRPTGFNIEGLLTWFHDAYGNCSYVNINTKLSDGLINFIDHDLELNFPENKVGLYKYDSYNDEWVSVN